MTDMSTFVPTLIASAFGGGLVAGIFTTYNRWAGKNDEHKQWLRDKKIEAYGDYLHSSDLLVLVFSDMRAGHAQAKTAVERFAAAQSTIVELVAPAGVRDAAYELDEHTTAMFNEALYGTLLTDEDEFDDEIDSYTAKRKEFLRLAQHDLDMAYRDNSASGSQLLALADTARRN
jgi:hypothetical protein